MKQCDGCGKDITHLKSKKYCSVACRLIVYHKKNGVQVWIKECGCGCGGSVISKTEEFKRDKIIGHPKKDKGYYSICKLCRQESDKVYDYQLPTFILKVCMPCYEKIFDMSMEE